MSKGFGRKKPFPLALYCSTNSPGEYERLFNAYKRHGLSRESAMQMVGISSLMRSLQDAGFRDGEHFGHNQEEGLWLSAEALKHIEKSAPAGVFEQWAKQGQLKPRKTEEE